MAGSSQHSGTRKSIARPHKKAKHELDVRPKSSPKTSILKKTARVVVQPPIASTSSNGKEKAREATTIASKKKGKAKAEPTQNQSVHLPTSFKVIAGTYEKLLYGLEGTVTYEDPDFKFDLKPVFIFPAHVSCIKKVAASPSGGKWLATGSADEIVKVWDLRRRKEIGGLMHHEGSITHLEFPSRSHLLSASEDGTLCLFRARDWSVLPSLKGHKGRVNCVAVHPSGKVALSVGKDRTLRMWDLMRGKGSASMKLGKEGELVRWSVNGSMFVVQSMSTIDVYSTDMTLLHTLYHPSRLQDVKFCNRVNGEGELLLAAAEDKKISVYEIPLEKERTPMIIAAMVGHTNRVKAIDTLKIALPPSPNSDRTSTTIVSTASSDGKIHLYDLASVPKEITPNDERPQIPPIAVYDTKGSRLTCLTLADGDTGETVQGPGKRKRDDEDQVEEGDEWESQQGDGGDDEESESRSGEDEEEQEEEGEEEYENE